MLSFITSNRDITFWHVLLRMFLAMITGALIGLERSAKNRPAGFRTHILVCLGACIASMTGHYIYLVLHLPADITRLGAQVITGLGFIGAGAIIVTRRQTVKGLTTAAGLWATGIIGLALGAGFYEGALVAVVCILIVETLFTHLNTKIRHATEFSLDLHYADRAALDHVVRGCKDHNLAITSLQIIGKMEDEPPVYDAALSLRAYKTIDIENIMDFIEALPGVIAVTLTGFSQ